MALHPILFPIDQPIMPESRQIGRRGEIGDLEARIITAGHQWLIGPRRTGKTSVAKAVLARLRQRHRVALDVDLSKVVVSESRDLAGEIARQAQAAHVGSNKMPKRLRDIARGQSQKAKQLSGALKGIGFDSEADALAAAASVLAEADDGGPGLQPVLEALSLHARATGKSVTVLLDEVHLLADLPGAVEEVAIACREEDCPIVFLFAGSEEAAVRALREEGPLEQIGQEFTLGEIGFSDWLTGLGDRFEEAGVAIEQGDLYRILEASDGHPRRTMLICSYAHSAMRAQGTDTASSEVVGFAIRDAQGDRAWA
ncbi:MAG: AAA family ATPase [Solirubrobacterales bacterium]